LDQSAVDFVSLIDDSGLSCKC